MAVNTPSAFWKRFDTYPPLQGNLSTGGGASPLNLTTASSIKAIWQSTTVVPTVLGKGFCSNASPIAGFVQYSWGTSDLGVADTYQLEFEVLWNSGSQTETFPNQYPNNPTFTVYPDLEEQLMPIEFMEIPQGAPSVYPVSASSTIQAGYCSPSDVASLNKTRSAAWGLANMPNITDVDGYIIMVAGQIDAILTAKGYDVPVDTTVYPEIEGMLAYVNAQGAAYMVEEASPNSPNIDRVKAAFDAAMMSLEAAQFALDAPVDQDRAEVRAPYLTYTPEQGTFDPQLHDTQWGDSGDGISAGITNRVRLPFFSRSMRF